MLTGEAGVGREGERGPGLATLSVWSCSVMVCSLQNASAQEDLEKPMHHFPRWSSL